MRRFGRRAPKLTATRIIKALIAFGPVASYAAANYSKSGGGMNGITKGVLPTLSTAYTGFNPNDGHWRLNDMTIGYVPMLGAWLFGKINARLRVL